MAQFYHVCGTTEPQVHPLTLTLASFFTFISVFPSVEKVIRLKVTETNLNYVNKKREIYDKNTGVSHERRMWLGPVTAAVRGHSIPPPAILVSLSLPLPCPLSLQPSFLHRVETWSQAAPELYLLKPHWLP